jgi:hypothetical protein
MKSSSSVAMSDARRRGGSLITQSRDCQRKAKLGGASDNGGAIFAEIEHEIATNHVRHMLLIKTSQSPDANLTYFPPFGTLISLPNSIYKCLTEPDKEMGCLIGSASIVCDRPSTNRSMRVV